MAVRLDIRYGLTAERAELEEIQRQASLHWDEYRADLLANPDAIDIPLSQLEENQVRVAERDAVRVGFSAVIAGDGPGVLALDGLFVLPAYWKGGIGRALLADALDLATLQGAHSLEVVANPRARVFYERCGFVVCGETVTRFGPALSMRLSIPKQDFKHQRCLVRRKR